MDFYILFDRVVVTLVGKIVQGMNAAESLQKSGLVDDARRIYQELLAITEDAARRSVLNHRIQQLWLNQSSQ